MLPFAPLGEVGADRGREHFLGLPGAMLGQHPPARPATHCPVRPTPRCGVTAPPLTPLKKDGESPRRRLGTGPGARWRFTPRPPPPRGRSRTRHPCGKAIRTPLWDAADPRILRRSVAGREAFRWASCKGPTDLERTARVGGMGAPCRFSPVPLQVSRRGLWTAARRPRYPESMACTVRRAISCPSPFDSPKGNPGPASVPRGQR